MDKTPGRIMKLEEVVINRIAAGEVIQRPSNALKELLENSLDAGALNIQVVVKGGGMKLLQIQDDGSGIREQDLPIVCERFTTSKLSTFEDLQSIGTYGFRGEALASISHVAHLTLITKTEGSLCALRAEYVDGRLKEFEDGEGEGVQNPRRVAANQGTTIMVEDLFYNMETRRKALRNTTEEHNRIADVITRYAIHNHGVGFSLKKFGEAMPEIRTPPGSTTLENIKILFGALIARELIPVSCEDISTKFKMAGYISNVNYSTKKSLFTLFINNRLVDSSGLRKSIESIYSSYLPKGTHPFAYISIELDPRNVDVNVHPTKHEVHFLHEDSIITSITASVENVLLGANESRTFLVQSLLPGASVASTSTSSTTNKKRKDLDSSAVANNATKKSGHQDPKNMVRTDPKLQKLDRFAIMNSTPNPDASRLKSFCDSPSRLQLNDSSVLHQSTQPEPVRKSSESDESSQTLPNSTRPVTSTSTAVSRKKPIRLNSVKNMLQEIKTNCHDGLLNLFRNHTFVGTIDRNLALFQHETTLYAGSIFRLSAELFYQKLVQEFGNFGRINIDDPIELKELIGLAVDCSVQEDLENNKEAIVENTSKLLMSKRAMLDDYFSLTFNKDGFVTSIPMLLTNYFPNMEGLPSYIMNLAHKVDWTHEERCFETFCHQTAIFYAVPSGNDEDNAEITLNGRSWKWTIENVIFPELQKSFLPPKVIAEDVTLVEITSLPALYKVFERC